MFGTNGTNGTNETSGTVGTDGIWNGTITHSASDG